MQASGYLRLSATSLQEDPPDESPISKSAFLARAVGQGLKLGIMSTTALAITDSLSIERSLNYSSKAQIRDYSDRPTVEELTRSQLRLGCDSNRSRNASIRATLMV